MKAFVINLESRPDRLDLFHKNYTHHTDVDLHVKKAVNGTLLHTSVSFSKVFKTLPNITAGEVGCFLSHYEIWTHMIECNIPSCIVYEDDAHFVTNYNEILSQVLKELPEDFNILYLGGRFTPNCTPDMKFFTQVSQHIVKHRTNIKYSMIHQDRTTHAYIISLKYAKLLCTHVLQNKDTLCVAVDHFLLKWLLKRNMDVHNVHPLIAWSPRTGDSDIAFDRGKRNIMSKDTSFQHMLSN